MKSRRYFVGAVVIATTVGTEYFRINLFTVGLSNPSNPWNPDPSLPKQLPKLFNTQFGHLILYLSAPSVRVEVLLPSKLLRKRNGKQMPKQMPKQRQ